MTPHTFSADVELERLRSISRTPSPSPYPLENMPSTPSPNGSCNMMPMPRLYAEKDCGGYNPQMARHPYQIVPPRTHAGAYASAEPNYHVPCHGLHEPLEWSGSDQFQQAQLGQHYHHQSHVLQQSYNTSEQHLVMPKLGRAEQVALSLLRQQSEGPTPSVQALLAPQARQEEEVKVATHKVTQQQQQQLEQAPSLDKILRRTRRFDKKKEREIVSSTASTVDTSEGAVDQDWKGNQKASPAWDTANGTEVQPDQDRQALGTLVGAQDAPQYQAPYVVGDGHCSAPYVLVDAYGRVQQQVDPQTLGQHLPAQAQPGLSMAAHNSYLPAFNQMSAPVPCTMVLSLEYMLVAPHRSGAHGQTEQTQFNAQQAQPTTQSYSRRLSNTSTCSEDVPPQLGSEDLPSVGSVGHYLRRCKPCAFVTRTGCSNGAQCSFCHLCQPGEKKRRRKEKRSLAGVARRLAVDARNAQISMI